MRIIRKVCKGNEIIFDETQNASDDFYDNVNFRTLRLMLKEDTAELIELEKMQKSGSNLKPQLSDDDLAAYIKIVTDKIYSVQNAIKVVATKHFGAERLEDVEMKEMIDMMYKEE